MRRARLAVLPFVSAVLIASSASAQMYESVGIRAQGMAGAFVAVADDSTATWWNPAGLATGPYFDVLAEYGDPDLVSGQRILGAALAMPAFGVSYYRLPISEMRLAPPIGDTPSSRQDQGYLSQFGATFGQSVGHIVLASTVKVLHAGNDTHVDLDLGAMATLGHLKAGVSLRNLHETDYNVPGAAPVSLKRIARAGVSFTGAPGGVVLTAAADADLTSVTTVTGDVRHIAGGVEAWVWKRIIGVRGGLSAETEHSVNSHSGGLSLMVLSGRYLHTYVDGQWTGGSDTIRRGWGVDLRLTF